jgi:hypothetical protein
MILHLHCKKFYLFIFNQNKKKEKKILFRFFYIGTMFVLTATFLYGYEKPKTSTSGTEQPRI